MDSATEVLPVPGRAEEEQDWPARDGAGAGLAAAGVLGAELAHG